MIEDYYLQLAAYSLAHTVVHNSKNTQGIVLLCTVDNLFQDFRIQGEKLEEYQNKFLEKVEQYYHHCLLYTSPSPRDGLLSRMPSSA